MYPNYSRKLLAWANRVVASGHAILHIPPKSYKNNTGGLFFKLIPLEITIIIMVIKANITMVD